MWGNTVVRGKEKKRMSSKFKNKHLLVLEIRQFGDMLYIKVPVKKTSQIWLPDF